MNAIGLAEQEGGRAVGFFCGKCGRPQIPHNCHGVVDERELTELHRKADLCCTTSVCEKHDYQLYNWHLCPHCVQEGPATDSKSGGNYTESMQPAALQFADGNRLVPRSAANAAKRKRKAAAR